ncbi:MAG: hypothetical protein AAFU38_21050, partial [Bacteroidota bacterium]
MNVPTHTPPSVSSKSATTRAVDSLGSAAACGESGCTRRSASTRRAPPPDVPTSTLPSLTYDEVYTLAEGSD